MKKQVNINNTDGILTVSSLQVAKDFEKRHNHIIRDIEKILKTIKTQNGGLTPIFFENTYQAGTGKNYKYYEMTRDGFCLLAMGFTDKKAIQWKLNYIDAFNLIETKLKEQSPPK